MDIIDSGGLFIGAASIPIAGCRGRSFRSAVLDNKELEREYNTLDALRTHPDIHRFSEWVATKPPDTHVRVRRKKS